MATTPITSAMLEAQVALAVIAIDANDSDGAVAAAVKIEFFLTALADYGMGPVNVKYSREFIDKLIEHVHLLDRMRRKVHGGLMTVADFQGNSG